MLRLLGFSLRMLIRLKVILLAVAGGMGIAYGLQARELSRSWGLLPGDAERGLPGDDLVARPDRIETRSLIIDAPPADVWPWLVQLGVGRGGWYAFGQLDRFGPMGGASPIHSADEILPEFQELSVGDIVPMQPGGGGGFEARVVEPGKALVLYLDDAIARRQAEEQAASGSAQAAESVREMDLPDFRVTWAFVLEPEPADRTRLIERFRVQLDVSPSQRRAMPLMGLGVFTLMRSQMLGIQRRVEGAATRAA